MEIRFRCVVGTAYDSQRMHADYVQFVKTTRDQFNNESCEVVTDATPYWVGDYFDDETGEYLGADGEGLTGVPKNPSPSIIKSEQPKGLANLEIADEREASPW